MPTLIRIIAVVFAALATSIVCQIAFSLVPALESEPWLVSVGSLLCALLVARYVWKLSAAPPAGFIAYVARSAIVTGAIGFALGFLGPMILAPGANQGPLFGIFISGPIGVLVGAVGGAIYWSRRHRAVADR
jgi:hypothetical protein